MLTKKSVILAMALILSACGYHLRGALELPAGMKNVYLAGGSAELSAQFNKMMNISSVPVASSPETADIIVRIFDEENQRRVLSLGAGGVANDFELSYSFDFEIVDSKNKVLSARQPIDIKREYFNDQQAIIAKGNEETVIITEMYQQALRTMINRARMALETSIK